MSHRQFHDESGRRWEAWDVYPSSVERHLANEQQTTTTGGHDGSSRTMTFTLPAELRAGWLAFQCDSESRRLAPIPANWDRLSDSDLVRLAEDAKRIVRAAKVRQTR